MAVREVPGEAAYRVTAPLVIVRCAPEGTYHHLYSQDMVPSTVDPHQLQTLIESGMVTRINEG